MALSRRRIVDPPKISNDPLEPSKEKLLVEINSEEVAERIARLHKIATRPLSLLSTEQCSDLEAMRKLSRKSFGTPAYEILHSNIVRLFTSRTYDPHTVGSFFVGCLIPTNISDVLADVNPGCSLFCSSGSFPSPDKTWGFCSQNVVSCLFSSSTTARNIRDARNRPPGSLGFVESVSSSSQPDSFDFVYITHVSSSSKAILFVDYTSYALFPGFTKKEKACLIHRMGIVTIKLLSYDRDATGYSDLIGKTIKVDDIKSRSEPERRFTTSGGKKKQVLVPLHPVESGWEIPVTWQQVTILTGTLGILIILVIAAVMLLRSRPGSKTKSRTRPHG